MSEYNIVSMDRLVEQFERMPGIGHKSAVRLAYYILKLPESETKKLTDAIVEAHKKIHLCRLCCNFTDRELCSICADNNRDNSVICVVENPKDLIAFEKTKEFYGRYHVLHGVISPLLGVSPDMLKIKELLARLKDGGIKEVIMATNASSEGEATAMYISRLIKPLGVKVSRLAYGIPVGADLEYTDEVTLSRALEGRNEM